MSAYWMYDQATQADYADPGTEGITTRCDVMVHTWSPRKMPCKPHQCKRRATDRGRCWQHAHLILFFTCPECGPGSELVMTPGAVEEDDDA